MPPGGLYDLVAHPLRIRVRLAHVASFHPHAAPALHRRGKQQRAKREIFFQQADQFFDLCAYGRFVEVTSVRIVRPQREDDQFRLQRNGLPDDLRVAVHRREGVAVDPHAVEEDAPVAVFEREAVVNLPGIGGIGRRRTERDRGDGLPQRNHRALFGIAQRAQDVVGERVRGFQQRRFAVVECAEAVERRILRRDREFGRTPVAGERHPRYAGHFVRADLCAARGGPFPGRGDCVVGRFVGAREPQRCDQPASRIAEKHLQAAPYAVREESGLHVRIAQLQDRYGQLLLAALKPGELAEQAFECLHVTRDPVARRIGDTRRRHLLDLERRQRRHGGSLVRSPDETARQHGDQQ